MNVISQMFPGHPHRERGWGLSPKSGSMTMRYNQCVVRCLLCDTLFWMEVVCPVGRCCVARERMLIPLLAIAAALQHAPSGSILLPVRAEASHPMALHTAPSTLPKNPESSPKASGGGSAETLQDF